MPESQEVTAPTPLSSSTVAMLASVAVAYGHIVGGIYLIAFWRRFGFQAFQHGGVAELLPAGIAAIGVLVVLIFIGAAVGQLIALALSAPSVPAPVGPWVAVVLFLGFAAFFIWGPASRWWLAAGLLLQLALTICFMRFNLLPERFRSFGVATGIAVATGYAPAAAAFIANADADTAISSSSDWIVAEGSAGLPSRKERYLKYVGRLGKSMVFYAPCSRTTWLVTDADDQPFAHRQASSKESASCSRPQ